MHPNVFLRTFWQMELRPEVFVAMTFSEDHRPRYEQVIAPAIKTVGLEPRRVDESKSGDCIVTEIMDGIAHAQLVLADVSTLSKDPSSSRVYRNGNVMFEVGIALACRQPEEVLLIRDDDDPFLFDVSTIPHIPLDFTKTADARARVREELESRLCERQLIRDARVRQAFTRLSPAEVERLRQFAKYEPTKAVEFHPVMVPDFGNTFYYLPDPAIDRLLDKQLIRTAGWSEKGHIAYVTTELGRVVVGLVSSGPGEVGAGVLPEAPSGDGQGGTSPETADAPGPEAPDGPVTDPNP